MSRTCTVTFDLNGGTGTTPSSIVFTDKYIILQDVSDITPPYDESNTLYFICWTDRNTGVEYKSGDVLYNHGRTYDLMAVWSPDQGATLGCQGLVIFDLDDGSLPEYQYYDDIQSAVFPTPYMSGFVFVHWVDEDGNIYQGGYEYINETLEHKDDLYVTAIWKELPPVYIKTIDGWKVGKQIYKKTEDGWILAKGIKIKTINGWQ